MTVIVEGIEQAIGAALFGGADVSHELADQATGRNVTVTFPAGPVIEYVQWNDETRAAAGL